MAGVKLITSFLLYAKLEDLTLKQIQHSQSDQRCQKCFLHFILILLSMAWFSYAGVKGGLVLYNILYNTSYLPMHVTFEALLISATAFGFIEMCIAFGSICAMRRLKGHRIPHWLNSQYRELNEKGDPIKKSVDLPRLFSLTKPVRL